MSDKFSTLAEMVKAKIKEEGGRITFKELARWAENTEISSFFVLYAIVKDLIDRGELVAPEGYEEDPELMAWQVPKIVALPGVGQEEIIEEREERPKLDIDVERLDEDLKRALSYLSDYWSVGEIRFKLDLKRLGVQDPDKVLLKLLDMGIVELTSTGVVNLKVEIPKVKKRPSLAGLI
ncbi:MAG: hypothetical protein QE164_05990 [Candidatus Nezhaarchaeota archaeon]|nr:hypothetical protein [Candidatus Nezhaarchaeota archaeon]